MARKLSLKEYIDYGDRNGLLTVILRIILSPGARPIKDSLFC